MLLQNYLGEFTIKLESVLCVILCIFLVLPIISSQSVIYSVNHSDQYHYYHSSMVIINIAEKSKVYEGSIINCTIQGNPTRLYWTINNQSEHDTFYKSDPILFDPEPTPINDSYCSLSVFAEYSNGTIHCDTVDIQLYRIYFGDIHFHSIYSDGFHEIDTLLENAKTDQYVDFACVTDHAEIVNSLDHTPPQPLWMFLRSLKQFLRYQLTDYDEWELIKEKTSSFYTPGFFSTFLGFEYSPGPWYKGGFPWSEHGHEDIGHINFYYTDVYTDSLELSARDCETWHEVLDTMNAEHEKGHLNFAFAHHPLAKFGFFGAYTVNWTYLAQNIMNNTSKTVFLGAEVYSKWGQAIGKYSGIPITWPYSTSSIADKPQYWVENALWEWSNLEQKKPFLMIASSDNHATDRPASASFDSRISSSDPNPAGIIATYAVHNTRSELWDAISQGFAYGTQLLKIRSLVTFDDQIVLGRWINCSSPLQINISACSTFPGMDSSGKSMTPHAYSSDELDYPIEDIWIVKKDVSKGQPWCKIIAHEKPESNVAVLKVEDETVQANDFYYIVIRQKGQYLNGNKDSGSGEETNDYLAFLGPIFINEVN